MTDLDADFAGWRATIATSTVLMGHSKEQLNFIFARTVMAGHCGPEELDPKGQVYCSGVILDYLDELVMADKQKHIYFAICDAELIKTMSVNVAKRLEMVCPRRTTAASMKRRMGLVPDCAEVEDCTSLLEGGDIPFVLRSRLDETWMLFGQYYLDGVKYGEGYEAEKCKVVILEVDSID